MADDEWSYLTIESATDWVEVRTKEDGEDHGTADWEITSGLGSLWMILPLRPLQSNRRNFLKETGEVKHKIQFRKAA